MAGSPQHVHAEDVSAGVAEETLIVPHNLEAPRLARLWLGHRLAVVASEVMHDAALLTSELVANAVLHGRPDVELTVRVTPEALWIAVTDRDPTPPALPDQLVDPSQTSGRGLFIVKALAASWGLDLRRDPPGKTVWFTLDIA